MRSLLIFCLACSNTDAESLQQAIVDGPIDFVAELDVSSGSVSGVSSLDAADIDGDGLVDVLALEGGKHAGDRVTFAWFESPADPSTDAWARHDLNRPDPFRPFIGAAKLGDIDGDGDPDLVVSMDNHSGGTRSAYLYAMINPRPGDVTADWTVHTIASDLAVHHINDMELADLDGDDRLDVIVRALEPNQLRLYFQDSPSSWQEKVIDSSPFGATGEGFAVGDIDRSGELDISICGHWLQAPGNPRTQSYTAHDIDAGYESINANVKEAIGDIDGDGRNDVIISPAEGYRSGGNHVLAWYRAPEDPTGTWTQNVIASDYNGGHTVKLGDLDGDGDLDVVSGVAWSMWGQTQQVRIFFNTGGGAFDETQQVVMGKGLYSGVLVDLGNDGDLDIVGQDSYAGSSRPYVYVSEEGPADTDAGGPTLDAGSDASSDTDAGSSDGGPGFDGGPDFDAGTRDAGVDAGDEPSDGGCGCRTTGSAQGSYALLCLSLLARRSRNVSRRRTR